MSTAICKPVMRLLLFFTELSYLSLLFICFRALKEMKVVPTQWVILWETLRNIYIIEIRKYFQLNTGFALFISKSLTASFTLSCEVMMPWSDEEPYKEALSWKHCPSLFFPEGINYYYMKNKRQFWIFSPHLTKGHHQSMFLWLTFILWITQYIQRSLKGLELKFC